LRLDSSLAVHSTSHEGDLVLVFSILYALVGVSKVEE